VPSVLPVVRRVYVGRVSQSADAGEDSRGHRLSRLVRPLLAEVGRAPVRRVRPPSTSDGRRPFQVNTATDPTPGAPPTPPDGKLGRRGLKRLKFLMQSAKPPSAANAGLGCFPAILNDQLPAEWATARRHAAVVGAKNRCAPRVCPRGQVHPASHPASPYLSLFIPTALPGQSWPAP
jgi:hypothetical protein